MMLFRLLNAQGIAGLAAATILALLLIGAKIDARHFSKQSARFEQLYRAEAKAHAETIANVRLATERARAADRVNAERVRAVQAQINERTAHEFEARRAAARARFDRLRDPAEAATGRGGGRAAPVPRLSAPAPGASRAAGQVGLPDSDRLIATEQAIQLDELIKWVRAQSVVEPSAPAGD